MRHNHKKRIAIGLLGGVGLCVGVLAVAAEPPPLPKPGVQITPIPGQQESAKPQVTVNGTAATKLAQQGTAQGAVPAKGDEAIRQAIRDRMQGQGELVIRAVDSPPPASSTAVAQPTGQSSGAADGASSAAAGKPQARPAAPKSSEPAFTPVTLGGGKSEAKPAAKSMSLPSQRRLSSGPTTGIAVPRCGANCTRVMRHARKGAFNHRSTCGMGSASIFPRSISTLSLPR